MNDELSLIMRHLAHLCRKGLEKGRWRKSTCKTEKEVQKEKHKWNTDKNITELARSEWINNLPAIRKKDVINSLPKEELKKCKISKLGRKPGTLAAERENGKSLLENSHNID